MSIKISELPVASSVNSADIVPIVQDGTTKQAQAEMLKPQIETVINSSSTNDKPVGAKAVYDYSAPIKHDSETQEYGVATTTKYGHTKIIDSLDSSSYQVGESLSAYQGAVLKQSIDDINDDIESITDKLATKQTISNMTNTLDENSTNTQYPNAKVTYEKYSELLNQIPTATATGNPINVQDSSNLPIVDFALLGNATQEDTPTPDTPQDIHVVTGDNTVKVLGKNLYNATNYTRGWSGTDVTYTNKSIILKRNAQNSGGLDAAVDTKCSNMFVPANTPITFSMKYISGTILAGTSTTNFWRFNLFRINKDGTVVNTSENRIQVNILGTTIPTQIVFSTTGTFSQDSYGFKVGCYIPANTAYTNGTNVVFDCQVEIGSTATAYEPYTEQTQLLSLGSIELAKIGTYTDRIFKDSGKWYVEKNIYKQIFNGSEAWAVSNTGTENWFYRWYTASNLAKTNAGFSNYYNCGANIGNTNTNTGLGIAPSSSNFYVRIRYGTEDTIENFKTWLSTHNLILYYPLATPTTTEITDTTLIGQLEELLKKRTNKNVTNISIVPTNAEPTAEVEYRVDLGTVISNLNARLTLLE